MTYDVSLIDDITNVIEHRSCFSDIDDDRVCSMLTFLSEIRTRYKVGELNTPKDEYDKMINTIHSALEKKLDSFDVNGINVRVERDGDELTRVAFYMDCDTNLIENYAFIDESNGYPINEEIIANNVIFIEKL